MALLNQEDRNTMLTSEGYLALLGQLQFYKSNIKTIDGFVPRKPQEFCFITFNTQLSFLICLGFYWIIAIP